MILRYPQKLAFRQMRARHLLKKGCFERGNFTINKEASPQPTQRSESRGSLLTLPSRKEEKPA